MNWIDYSLIMFFSSVVLYLCIRKSSIEKVPLPLTNLAMFAIPLVAFALIGATTNTKFSVSAWQVVVLVVAGIVFSFGGNTVSLKAIDIAPNPGYSLVLSKSYVLFTTVVAVLLLNAELTFKKAVAILIVVGFSFLIIAKPEKVKNVQNHKWVTLSFGAFFAWGMLSLTSKYLFSHGVSTIAFILYLSIVVTVCIVVANKISYKSFKSLKPAHWLLLLSCGLFSVLFYLGQFEATRLAPNLGYVNAINAGSISLVTILAVLFFKDELTLQKAAGIAGVTAGLLLLLI